MKIKFMMLSQWSDGESHLQIIRRDKARSYWGATPLRYSRFLAMMLAYAMQFDLRRQSTIQALIGDPSEVTSNALELDGFPR